MDVIPLPTSTSFNFGQSENALAPIDCILSPRYTFSRSGAPLNTLSSMVVISQPSATESSVILATTEFVSSTSPKAPSLIPVTVRSPTDAGIANLVSRTPLVFGAYSQETNNPSLSITHT